MKSLSKTLLALLLCLTSAVTMSQNVKSNIFSQFPDVINSTESEFSNAFTAKEGDIVTFSFSNNLIIKGKVISNIQKYSNLQSMTLQVPDYANAVFHLSKQTNSDQSFSFVGRILSTEALDGYEITKDGLGNYRLNKVAEESIRQICSN